MNRVNSIFFLHTFEQHCTDPKLQGELRAVGAAFLAATERKHITGSPYVVLCLIVAQAIQNVVDGGLGSRLNLTLLHEAIGMSCAADAYRTPDAAAAEGSTPCSNFKTDRYGPLVDCVARCQSTKAAFWTTLNEFLYFDQNEGWNQKDEQKNGEQKNGLSGNLQS